MLFQNFPPRFNYFIYIRISKEISFLSVILIKNIYNIWFENNFIKFFIPFKKNKKYFYLKKNKFTKKNYKYSLKKFNLNNFYKNNKNIKLYEIIKLKKKSGFLKRNDKINNFILFKIRNYYIKNKKTNKFVFKNYSQKTVDFRKKLYILLIKNRNILKTFFIKKNYRQFKINKLIKKIIKIEKSFFLNYYSLRLNTFLLKLNFFFNFKDTNFFIKNGYISVNKKIVFNENYIIKKNDFTKIILTKYYYVFYKKTYKNIYKVIFKINSRIWILTRNKFDINKQKTQKVHNWVWNYLYFKNDVPSFVEVDFPTLSVCLLYIPFKLIYYDYLTLKYLNMFLTRTYNWKYIV